MDPKNIRPDLSEVIARHESTLDEMRTEAVARRHKSGQRTIRENIADLLDPDKSIEYGSLALAAQRRRKSMDKLIQSTPADGLVAKIGSINGHLFDPSESRCLVIGYDYTVLAGTQGWFNHHKKDRMLELAYKQKLPTVLYAEGGGGRRGVRIGASTRVRCRCHHRPGQDRRSPLWPDSK